MDKERDFILNNQKNWDQLSILINKKNKAFAEVYELGNLYQQVTENLSHVQTYFPDSELEIYLNQLVRQCHMVLFKSKNSHWKNIFSFYTNILPKILYKLKIPILISLIIFLISIFLSFFITKNNLELSEMFLSPQAYQMAVNDLDLRKQFGNFDNIPKDTRGAMSFFIWMNNSLVSLYCFVWGISLGLGTVYFLIKNGFMLGTLLSIYYMNGHFIDFFSIIMVHGTIELTAIIIASAAGFNLAQAILFPQRSKRSIKLKENAIIALQTLAGVVSLLLVSGIIEGMVTTAKPSIFIRFLIAGISFIFLLLYFYRGKLLIKKAVE